MENELTLYVVSHTHWDREWYQDFQHYRYRLVRMMDDLIGLLERDPDFKVFHLDGQTIVLRDYLEIRPENEARLRRLIKDGRIIIGPWYVMPDEFLISGESLIENLRTGHRISAEYGVEPMKNGYVTDIFGHNSQFPQILRGFGIADATLYRGIGDYPLDTFIWEGADGSRVTVAKLDRERSYSNFYFAVRQPFENGGYSDERAVAHMKHLLEHTSGLLTAPVALMMDGCDHLDAERRLPELLRLFEREIPGVKFIHAPLSEYCRAHAECGAQLETLTGALYSLGRRGVNNQVLRNVLSSMITLKQKNDACERLLKNYAAPLDAMTAFVNRVTPLGPDEYFATPRNGFMRRAWEYLLEKHPHDSICGCSRSEVHQDNENRFDQVSRLGDVIISDAMAELTREIQPLPEAKGGNVFLFNPVSSAREGCFETTLILPAGQPGPLRFYDSCGQEVEVQTLSRRTYTQSVHSLRHLITAEAHDEVRALVNLSLPPEGYEVLGFEAIPAPGMDDFNYGTRDYMRSRRQSGSLMTAPDTVDNGIYVIRFTENGRLDVTVKATGKTLRGLHVFEDCGDAGDGWNYRKPEFDAVVLDSSAAKSIAVASDGPLGCVVRVTKTLSLPADLAARASGGASVPTDVVTEFTVIRDNPVISCTTTLTNPVGQHRLRVLFPTGSDSDSFFTKTPFDMYRWDRDFGDESDYSEIETYVRPSQGVSFVPGEDSFSLYARGQYEVALSRDASATVALTLFRSPANETWRSVGYTALLMPLRFEYALCLADRTPAEAFSRGECWRNAPLPRFFRNSGAGGNLPRRFSAVTLSTDLVSLSAYERTEDGISLRLIETDGKELDFTAQLPRTIASAYLTDLLGNKTAPVPFEGDRLLLHIGAKSLLTVAVTFLP